MSIEHKYPGFSALGEAGPVAGHTKGPWAVEENVSAGGVIHLAVTARHAGKDWMPCSISPQKLARDVDYANAWLIAMSPTLLRQVNQLRAALAGVIAVADRKTVEFDAAKAALAAVQISPGIPVSDEVLAEAAEFDRSREGRKP